MKIIWFKISHVKTHVAKMPLQNWKIKVAFLGPLRSQYDGRERHIFTTSLLSCVMYLSAVLCHIVELCISLGHFYHIFLNLILMISQFYYIYSL